jgi:hypothetical protein
MEIKIGRRKSQSLYALLIVWASFPDHLDFTVKEW